MQHRPEAQYIGLTSGELYKQAIHATPPVDADSAKRLEGEIRRSLYVASFVGPGSEYDKTIKKIEAETDGAMHVVSCFDPRNLKAHMGGKRRLTWKAAGALIHTRDYDLGARTDIKKVPYLHYLERDGRLLLPRVGADALAEELRFAVQKGRPFVTAVIAHTSLRLGLICGKMRSIQADRVKRGDPEPDYPLEVENLMLADSTVQANHNTFNLHLTDIQRFEGKPLRPVNKVAVKMLMDTDTHALVLKFYKNKPDASKTTATVESIYRDQIASLLAESCTGINGEKVGTPGSKRDKLRDPRFLSEITKAQYEIEKAIVENPRLSKLRGELMEWVDEIAEGCDDDQKLEILRYAAGTVAINYLGDTINPLDLFAHFQPKLMAMSPWGVTFNNLDPGWQRFSSTPPSESDTVSHMAVMWGLLNEKEQHAHEFDPHQGRNRFHSLGIYPRHLYFSVPANPVDVLERTDSLKYKLQDAGRITEEAYDNRFLSTLINRGVLEIYTVIVDRDTGAPLMFPNFPYRTGHLRFY